MNVEKLFKNIIFLQVAILIISLFYGVILGINEPDLAEEPFYLIDYVVLLIFLPAYLINLYLLYKFKPVARMLLVILTIMSFPLILFYPPEYLDSSKFEVFLESLGGMGDGALLALIYFSGLSEKFKPTNT